MLRFFKLRGKLLLPKSIIVLDDLRGVVPADLPDDFLHCFEITESAQCLACETRSRPAMRIRQRLLHVILQLLALLEVLQLHAVTQRRDPGDVIGDPVRGESSFVIVSAGGHRACCIRDTFGLAACGLLCSRAPVFTSAGALVAFASSTTLSSFVMSALPSIRCKPSTRRDSRDPSRDTGPCGSA